MNIPDELLAAYVNGELEGAERARIEQAIQHDSRVAQRVTQYRAMRTRLHGVFDGALPGPLSQRQPLRTARAIAPRGSAQIIDLARVRAERKRRNERHRALPPHRLAIAASLIAGLLLGLLIESLTFNGALTEYRDGGLLASGALAQALNTQLTSNAAPGSKVHVGLSFKAKGGDYCRTFSVNGSHSLAGLACHERNRWQILTLLQTQHPTANPRSVRVAAQVPPPALLQAVKERISGAPLDAEAEERARGGNWR